MNYLIFVTIILVLICLLHYFKANKPLLISGIIFGLFALSLKLLLPPCFGASTPVAISAKNKSKQVLEIYTIYFWDDYANGAWNFTQHVASLKPDQTATFCLDNDVGRFWILAKSSQGRVEFLEEVSTPDSRYEFTIEANRNIPTEKLSKAKKSIDAFDNKMKWESVLIWTNVVLTTMLCYRLLFRRK